MDETNIELTTKNTGRANVYEKAIDATLNEKATQAAKGRRKKRNTGGCTYNLYYQIAMKCLHNWYIQCLHVDKEE